MGISILSFNDKVYFGLIVDKKNVPDPQAIIDRFQPELEKLLMLTLMDDWERPLTPDPDAAEAMIDRVLAEAPARSKRRGSASAAAKPTTRPRRRKSAGPA
jgi:hypothetical protein